MGLLRWLGKLLLGRSQSRFAGYDAEDFDADVYHHFKSLIIPTARGSAEIDHLIVSKFGLFVVELKDRSGWIFGNESDAKWTSVHFGKKFRFQNPLHQNYGHAMALRELLGVGLEKMHQAVVFRGDFEFKTPIPAKVLCNWYAPWVRSKETVLLQEDQVRRILSILTATERSTLSSMEEHIESVQERLSSDTICPKCGGELRLRIARRGPEPGSTFLGCSNYPKCRFTKNEHAT